MSRLVSIGTKIKQLEGMVGTADLSDWETRFVRSISGRYQGGLIPGALTDNQIEKLEQLWEKHFA